MIRFEDVLSQSDSEVVFVKLWTLDLVIIAYLTQSGR